jgi:hypothetical protein
VLFIPVSGATGVGEYYRCLIIAAALSHRWPESAPEFVVSRQAGYADRVPYRAHLLDSSPTFATDAVTALMRERRPQIAVFDSTGRRAQLAAAHRLGIRTVYVSSRPSARARGFRPRSMRYLDQHWLVAPRFGAHALRWRERLLLRWMGRPEIVRVDTVVAEPEAAHAARVYRELGIERGRYFLACAGGGGYRSSGVPDSEIFAAAAEAAGRATGMPAVVVLGPNYRAAGNGHAGVRRIGSVTIEQMSDLMDGAALVLSGGGSLVMQALALRRPCIAVPLVADQERRVADLARAGCVCSAPLDAQRLAQALITLLNDPVQRTSLEQRVAACGLQNGVPTLIDALSRLAAEG